MSYSIQYEEKGPRSAFRATLPGLRVRIPSGLMIPLRDLSAGGVSFVLDHAENHLVQGTVARMDLYIADKMYMEALPCRVVRIGNNSLVAGAFENLNRHQEVRLDKLVLEIQKRLIAHRKLKKAEQAEADGQSAVAGIQTSEGADSAHTINLEDPDYE